MGGEGEGMATEAILGRVASHTGARLRCSLVEFLESESRREKLLFLENDVISIIPNFPYLIKE